MRQRLRIAGIACLAFLFLIPALYSKAKTVFTNMQKTINCTPSEVVTVHSTADVQAVIRQARSAGLRIKAAINGWQGSNDNSCVGSGGLQIDTSGLDQILSVDPELKQVMVQPGIRLWDFNQKTHKDWKLILPVLQEYAEPTLGGMLGNGTHGSSLTEPSSSIQDSVLAVTVVNAEGLARVVSGKELDYYATNLGVLGIITEIKLQLQPSFKVQAKLSSYDEKDLAANVLDQAAAYYAASITWFPGQKRYTVTGYDKVPNNTPGQAHNGQTETGWLERAVFPLIMKAGNLGPSRATMCFVEKQRYEMKTKSFYTETFGKPVDPAVGWAHELIYFVCRDRCPFNDLPYQLEEIAIDQKELPRFIGQAQELFDKTGACLPLNGIYFRFGHRSRGAIGMASDRETVYVGMEYVRNPWGNRYPKDYDVIQELEQLLLHEYAGRPHWGKNSAAMFTNARETYPRFAEFDAYREQQDPQHIFVNDFYARISGRAPPSTPAANCVVEGTCYCTADEHCPKDYHCEAGLVYTEARVCRP